MPSMDLSGRFFKNSMPSIFLYILLTRSHCFEALTLSCYLWPLSGANSTLTILCHISPAPVLPGVPAYSALRRSSSTLYFKKPVKHRFNHGH